MPGFDRDWYKTFLHCQKVRKIGWAHLPYQENYMLLIAAANQSACFSFSAAKNALQKHSVRAAVHRIRRFRWELYHQIAKCIWSCPTHHSHFLPTTFLEWFYIFVAWPLVWFSYTVCWGGFNVKSTSYLCWKCLLFGPVLCWVSRRL